MKGFVQMMAKALLGRPLREEETSEELARSAFEGEWRSSRKLEMVTLQLFLCSDFLLRFDHEPSAAAAEGFERSLGGFSTSLAKLEEEIFDAAGDAAAGNLLCGGNTVIFASTFVRELVSWATLSFQRWKATMKQQKVKDPALKALLARLKAALDEAITCFRQSLESLDKKMDSHVKSSGGSDASSRSWEGSPFLQLGCNMPLVSSNLEESQIASLKVTQDRLNKYYNLLKALQ
jgi:hypothetical protein